MAITSDAKRHKLDAKRAIYGRSKSTKQVAQDDGLTPSQLTKKKKLNKFKKRKQKLKHRKASVRTESEGETPPKSFREAVAQAAAELRDNGVEMLKPLKASTVVKSAEFAPSTDDTHALGLSRRKTNTFTVPAPPSLIDSRKTHVADLETTLNHVASACQGVAAQANATIGHIAQGIGCALNPDSHWSESAYDAKCVEVALAAEDAHVKAEVKHAIAENMEAHRCAQLSFADECAQLSIAEETALADKAMFDAIDRCYGSDDEDGVTDYGEDDFENISDTDFDPHAQSWEAADKGGLDTYKQPHSQKDAILEEVTASESELQSVTDDLIKFIRDGKTTRIRHAHRGPWELYSTRFYNLWREAGHRQTWEPPIGFVQRPIKRDKSDRMVSFGLIICGLPLRTDSFIVPKYTSKLPILVSAQEESDEYGRRSFDMEIQFLGSGYLKLRIPELVAVQSINGVLGEKAHLGLSDGLVFYGVQALD
jgi:hypothetical protein